MLLLDTHCDTPCQLLKGFDITKEYTEGHVDIPRMQRGGVGAAFFALYTPNTLSADASTRTALQMAAHVHDLIDAAPESLAAACSVEDIRENHAHGRISILLGMENGLAIQEDLALLREFYRLGVRYMTLTHNGDNAICDSAAEGKHWGGLSPFGETVVAEMNRIGMLVDVAHVSDATFWDCIRLSSKPIATTHSCCRALCGHRRNLSDEMIRALADKGGVLQINFYPFFLSDDGQADVDRIVDHIAHAVRIGGIDAVGIGSDFDGIECTPEGMSSCADFPRLWKALEQRGFSTSEIEKIAGENFLRVFSEIAQ